MSKYDKNNVSFHIIGYGIVVHNKLTSKNVTLQVLAELPQLANTAGLKNKGCPIPPGKKNATLG